MKTIKQINKQIKESAPVDAEIRYVQNYTGSQGHHQGDIALIECDFEPSTKEIDVRQLAKGTTKGSRHILSDFVGKVYESDDETPYHGYFIEAKERFTLTHPEHAHHCLPAGKYRVLHQVDYRTMERVRD